MFWRLAPRASLTPISRVRFHHRIHQHAVQTDYEQCDYGQAAEQQHLEARAGDAFAE
jgi:hypothetical protein